MPDPNLTDIVVIADRSASMRSKVPDVISGFNEFLQQQRQDTEGEVRFTFVTFSDTYTPVHERIALDDVPNLTPTSFVASGMTALMDAIGRTVDKLGETFAALPENEQPQNVIVAIITDGGENVSKEYNRTQVREMIERQEHQWGWNFIYLAEGPEAFQEAQNLGILSSVQTHDDSKGREAVYCAMSFAAGSARRGRRVSGQALRASYTKSYQGDKGDSSGG